MTEIARNYAKLRYRLMPLLYSLFYEAHTKGMPIQRSLCMQYGHEEEVWSQAYDSQFMLGDDLLICPVPSDQTISKVYLPKGDWFDFYSDKHYAGGQALGRKPTTSFTGLCTRRRNPTLCKAV